MSETATYIRKLTIENVRCFGSDPQELILAPPDGRPHQWTVILGENGTGKTTLLECVASFYDFFENEADAKNKPVKRIVPSYHKNRKIQAPLVRRRRGKIAGLNFEIELSGPLTIEREGRIEVIDSEMFSEAQEQFFEHYVRVWNDKLILEKWDHMAQAYGVARSISNASFVNDDYKTDLISSLLGETRLRSADEWLLQVRYAYLASNNPQMKASFNKKYHLIRELLIDILPGVSDLDVAEPSIDTSQPRLLFKTQDGWLPLAWMGHGYRTLIAWMVDFASRMVERYPTSENPLKEPALVLVDEIDLHLHPKWQRDLMNHLTKHFPNTQFIVTAHSPIFVQAAENANLVVLRRDKEKGHVVIENAPEKIRGWRLDQILTSDLFGLPSARSPEVEKLQEERISILSKPKLTATDTKRVAELEEKMGGLPAGESAAEVKTKQLLDRVLQSLQQIPNINQSGAGEAT